MIASVNSFDNMYSSFKFFSLMGRTWHDDFLPMSAGANWISACPSIRSMLRAELDAATTYRNYGRALGLKPITDLLEMVESSIAGHTDSNFAVTITNGTTEGAHLCLEALIESGTLQHGDQAFVIGHAYPLYHLLPARFGLVTNEILAPDDNHESLLPAIDQVLQALNDKAPKMVFLLAPNNPVGECYDRPDLSLIVDWCREHKASMLVDRVCQMPWDDRSALMGSLSEGIAAGIVFVADSLSKSESLAGIRTGFLISGRRWQPSLEKLTQYRYLNPIIFSTVTLAMVRVAEAGPTLQSTASRLISAHVPSLYCEYPKGEPRLNIQRCFEECLEKYPEEMSSRRAVIEANHTSLLSAFSAVACRRLQLQSGFNVCLELPQMNVDNEVYDQHELGKAFGVGVLTERCFRQDPRRSGRYFIRLGLSLSVAEFQDGLNRLKSFYAMSDKA
jgi:aspartate/methionine/tyrosine aminotransferase